MSSVDRITDVKSSIRACLIAHKGNCTVSQLNKDYREFQGENIPYREFNCRNLEDLLSTLTDVLRIVHRDGEYYIKAIDTENTRHVSALVSNQRTAKRSKSHHSRKHSNDQQRYMDSDRGMNRGRNSTTESRSRSHHQQNTSRCNNSSNSSRDNYHQSRKSAVMSDNDYYSRRNSAQRVEDKENYCSNRQSTYEADRREKNKTPAQSNNVSQQYYVDRQRRYEPEMREIKSKTCVSGPESNSSASSQVSNNTSCMGNHSADNSDSKSQEINNSNRSLLISPRNKERLRDLIRRHPEGIWCAEFPEKYVNTYNVHFNYAELGFNSVREVASELPEIFHCIKLVEAGDYKLFNAQKPLPVNQKMERRIPVPEEPSKKHDSAAFPNNLDADTRKKLIPEGAMEINESVGHISVTEIFKDKQYEEIFLSELYTPSNFYIQLKRRQSGFKQMMSDLNAFYEEKKTKYGVHPIMVEKNLNIACLYEKIWHRGIIKSVGEDKRSLIYFYDFGTVKTYNPEELFFLDRRFSHLPAQAIPSGLYNTKPCNSKSWDHSITYEFKRKVWNIPLMATVASNYVTDDDFMNVEDNSILVSLTDTRKSEDFHINDWMVEMKFAKQGRLNHTKSRNFAFLHYLDCLQQKGYDPSIICNLSDSNINIEDPVLCRDFNFNELKKASRPSLPLSKKKPITEKQEISSPSTSPLSSSHSSSMGATSGSAEIDSSNPKTNSFDRFKSLQKFLLRTQAKSSNSSVAENVNLTNHKESKELQNSADKTKYDVDTQVINNPNLKKVASDKKPQSPSITETSDSDSISVRSPLMLKNDIDESENSYFGTFRSQYGGNGQQGKINWAEIRECINADKRQAKETSSKPADNSQKPAANLEKSAATSSKDAEDSPKDLPQVDRTLPKPVDAPKVWKQNLPLIKSEMLNFINVDPKSAFYEKSVGFLPKGNVKTTTAIVSPILRLKQRLQANSTKSISVLVSPRITKVLKGEIQNEDSAKSSSKKNVSQQLSSEEKKEDKEEEKKEEKIVEDEEKKDENLSGSNQEEANDNEMAANYFQVMRARKMRVNALINKLNPCDNRPLLDEEIHNDFRREEANTYDEPNQISFVKPKAMKSGIRLQFSDESESLDSDDFSSSDGECEESKKEIITYPQQAQSQLVFNDVDVDSDAETWDGMSMSNGVTPAKFKSEKLNSSRDSSPERRYTNSNNDFVNNNFNNMSNYCTEAVSSEERLTLEEVRTPSRSARDEINHFRAPSPKTTAEFMPPGRSRSLKTMLMNMSREL